MRTVRELRDSYVAQVERAVSGTAGYKIQRKVVATMFDVLGRLLEAGSAIDPEIARDVQGFPEGYLIGLSLFGDSPRMRLRVQQGLFVRMLDSHVQKPDLDIVFKHVSHAFHVLTFRESTAEAFANDRAITHGDTALGMRFVRCLNRVEALALPGPIARRALKAPLPELSRRTRVELTSKLYGRVASDLLRRKAA